MSQEKNGVVRTEREGNTLIIEVDRQEKMNGFTPEMFEGISGAFEMLEQDNNLWVGVLCFAGKHSTAGLDLRELKGDEEARDQEAPRWHLCMESKVSLSHTPPAGTAVPRARRCVLYYAYSCTYTAVIRKRSGSGAGNRPILTDQCSKRVPIVEHFGRGNVQKYSWLP